MSEKQDRELTIRQEVFCQKYISEEFFANGVRSYGEAYGIDITNPKQYNVAKSGAHDHLTNPYILKRIAELLDLAGLNDGFVDQRLTFLMTQNAELAVAMSAIKEYNKLKKRIDNTLTVKGNLSIDVKFNKGDDQLP